MRTDERVRLMDEVISGVQVIKLYAWEKPFAKLITLARKMELKIVKKSAYVRGLYMTFGLFTTRMALFCTMLSMVLLGEDLTAAKVFVIASFYHVISHVMSQMFVRGIAEIAEALVAMKRLQKFLDYEEKDEAISNQKHKYLINELGLNGDAIEKEKLISNDLLHNDQFAVSLKNATARWSTVRAQTPIEKKKKSKKSKQAKENESESDIVKTPTLDNLNLDFKKGLLIGVIGPVGAGKSSLLETILQELPLESGRVLVNGSVSYASQEPWVFSGSVRQNILFGEKLQKDHYNTVIKSCALLTDFEQFPHGDDSIIGERGSSLSGGQKARIR
jgi:ATP-binding cassette, subfamily C (CFTR/MRP), member 4